MHLIKSIKKIFYLFITVFYLITSCTPPRAIYNSGKVTPHKQIKVGADFSANLTSHFARSLYENVEGIVTPLINKDSISLDEQIINLNKTAIAYAIDPFGAGYGFYARYGIIKKFDLGYKYTSGTHVFDGMYQFLGSDGTFDAPQDGKMFGSIGLQYSSKSYDLPSWSGLDKVQSILELKFKRKDILVPLIFSLSFGKEETIGSFSWGLVYTHSYIDYGFDNKRIYDTLNSIAPNEIVGAFNDKQNFSSYGAFINLKLGYKFIYLIPSFAVYYQNYGTYKLIDGTESGFKGFSTVPSIGLQINPTVIYKAIKKRKEVSKGT